MKILSFLIVYEFVYIVLYRLYRLFLMIFICLISVNKHYFNRGRGCYCVKSHQRADTEFIAV